MEKLKALTYLVTLFGACKMVCFIYERFKLMHRQNIVLEIKGVRARNQQLLKMNGSREEVYRHVTATETLTDWLQVVAICLAAFAAAFPFSFMMDRILFFTLAAIVGAAGVRMHNDLSKEITLAEDPVDLVAKEGEEIKGLQNKQESYTRVKAITALVILGFLGLYFLGPQ